jgi:hypothetical protein
VLLAGLAEVAVVRAISSRTLSQRACTCMYKLLYTKFEDELTGACLVCPDDRIESGLYPYITGGQAVPPRSVLPRTLDMCEISCAKSDFEKKKVPCDTVEWSFCDCLEKFSLSLLWSLCFASFFFFCGARKLRNYLAPCLRRQVTGCC